MDDASSGTSAALSAPTGGTASTSHVPARAYVMPMCESDDDDAARLGLRCSRRRTPLVKPEPMRLLLWTRTGGRSTRRRHCSFARQAGAVCVTRERASIGDQVVVNEGSAADPTV